MTGLHWQLARELTAEEKAKFRAPLTACEDAAIAEAAPKLPTVFSFTFDRWRLDTQENLHSMLTVALDADHIRPWFGERLAAAMEAQR